MDIRIAVNGQNLEVIGIQKYHDKKPLDCWMQDGRAVYAKKVGMTRSMAQTQEFAIADLKMEKATVGDDGICTVPCTIIHLPEDGEFLAETIKGKVHARA